MYNPVCTVLSNNGGVLKRYTCSFIGLQLHLRRRMDGGVVRALSTNASKCMTLIECCECDVLFFRLVGATWHFRLRWQWALGSWFSGFPPPLNTCNGIGCSSLNLYKVFLLLNSSPYTQRCVKVWVRMHASNCMKMFLHHETQ
jgi:hypothetical protein